VQIRVIRGDPFTWVPREELVDAMEVVANGALMANVAANLGDGGDDRFGMDIEPEIKCGFTHGVDDSFHSPASNKPATETRRACARRRRQFRNLGRNCLKHSGTIVPSSPLRHELSLTSFSGFYLGSRKMDCATTKVNNSPIPRKVRRHDAWSHGLTVGGIGRGRGLRAAPPGGCHQFERVWRLRALALKSPRTTIL
jgi:hypothetical protein